MIVPFPTWAILFPTGSTWLFIPFTRTLGSLYVHIPALLRPRDTMHCCFLLLPLLDALLLLKINCSFLQSLCPFLAYSSLGQRLLHHLLLLLSCTGL